MVFVCLCIKIYSDSTQDTKKTINSLLSFNNTFFLLFVLMVIKGLRRERGGLINIYSSVNCLTRNFFKVKSVSLLQQLKFSFISRCIFAVFRFSQNIVAICVCENSLKKTTFSPFIHIVYKRLFIHFI